MNTLIWEHPLTARHLRQVTVDAANVRIVGPITKGLACGDIGIGAMAEVDEIAAAVPSCLRAGSVSDGQEKWDRR
jgi:phosphopantothenoylcysteine decarboxylase